MASVVFFLTVSLASQAANAPGIATGAGTGQKGFGGDGGPAAAARLDQPFDVAIDAQGNVLLSDTFNHRIRKIDRRTGYHHDRGRQRHSWLFRRRRPRDRGPAQRALRRGRRSGGQPLPRRSPQPASPSGGRAVRRDLDDRGQRLADLFGRRRAGASGRAGRAQRRRPRRGRADALHRRRGRPSDPQSRSFHANDQHLRRYGQSVATRATAARPPGARSAAPARSRSGPTGRSISSSARAIRSGPSIRVPA